MKAMETVALGRRYSWGYAPREIRTPDGERVHIRFYDSRRWQWVCSCGRSSDRVSAFSTSLKRAVEGARTHAATKGHCA